MTDPLVAAQAEVFAGVDALLPAPTDPPPGVELTATLPDGRTVRGSVYRTLYGPDAVLSLWNPRVVWEFTPLIGDTGAAGMDAALGALRGWLEREVPAAEATGDSGVHVMWPSRDVEVARSLHAHGLVPTTALAVRSPRLEPPASEGPVTVRLATMADVAELVSVVQAEMQYSVEVMGARLRDNAVDLLTAGLKRSVYFDGRVFVAEVGGAAVGAAVCGLAKPTSGSSLANRLADGLWGYVGQFSVVPTARGTGVGGVLIAEAHRVLDADATRGTFLYYELANPLSSVFWPRRGYRPLWTRWTARPAALLR